jgi:23S rRNA (cytosine1962-C5)-methyltransferase
MKTRPATLQLSSDRLPAGPWVFARNLRPPAEPVEPGAWVELVDDRGRYVGHGFYNPASDIRVRLLSRGRRSELERPRQFLLGRLAAADRVRRKLLRLPEVTDAYRVVHAEGDDLSGLIVDKLGPVLVCEHHALGFWRVRDELEWALGELYPGLAVVHRVPPRAARAEGFEPEEPAVSHPEVELEEHGLRYVVAPGGGHKTGFFCDQRDNRRRVAGLAAGQDVLDLCCNLGGFALHAARAGARRVTAVDLDEQALERAERCAALNACDVRFVHADAFDHMRAMAGRREQAGLVVLDPHKLVEGQARREEGLRKYADLNALALERVRPGGALATFSCSGAVDLATFVGLVFKAARRAERGIRLLETLGAGPDHPQRPDFARSRYLKGLVLAVD